MAPSFALCTLIASNALALALLSLRMTTATCGGRYLVIQLQVNPYADTGDNFFAASCSFGIIVLFVCCIMFKLATLTELPDLQLRMSYASFTQTLCACAEMLRLEAQS